MKLKITKRARAEFEFYRTTQLDMIGVDVGVEIKSAPDGFTAIECWYARDTHGKHLPCKEPELLAKVTRSKQSVNLQVRLWAEDIADGMLLQKSELAGYLAGWPDWVFRAVMEQAAKISMESIGFVPGFARADAPCPTDH